MIRAQMFRIVSVVLRLALQCFGQERLLMFAAPANWGAVEKCCPSTCTFWWFIRLRARVVLH
jgi:hypothetical protein